MADRVQEIEGRLAGPVQAINIGPTPSQAIENPGLIFGEQFEFFTPGLPNSINTTTGLLSCWMYFSGAGYAWRIRNIGFGEVGSVQLVSFAGDGRLFARIVGPGQTTVIFVFSNAAATDTLIPFSQWFHLLIAWDTTLVTGFGVQVAVNGSLIPGAAFSSFTFTSGQVHTFNDATVTPNQEYMGSSAGPKAVNSIYLNDRETLPLTVSANIEKFILTDRYTPAQLGPDGSNPTGSQPILLVRPSGASTTNNVGFGINPIQDGTWLDAGHDPTTPARFAHGTGTTAQAGLSQDGSSLGLGATQLFTLSMWFRTDLTTTAGFLVIATDVSASNRLVIEYGTDGFVQITARNSSGTVILDTVATAEDISDDTWHHIGVSVDMTQSTALDAIRLYVDYVDTNPATTTFTSGESIDLGQAGLKLGFINQTHHPSLTTGNYSQIWFDVGVAVDFDTQALRDKFIGFVTGVGPIFPVDLGTDGSTPLGTVPLVLLGDAPTYIYLAEPHKANRGSGVDFDRDGTRWVSPDGNPSFSFS